MKTIFIGAANTIFSCITGGNMQEACTSGIISSTFCLIGSYIPD